MFMLCSRILESRASAAESETGMEMEITPTPEKKRRLTVFGKRARQKRIFARLREGWAYDEIASEERLTAARVRQIVSEVLQKRQVDDSMAHALLQLSRLGPAVQLAGEAVARGEINAIWPLLGALDRLDRYQKDACVIHRDNEAIRQKLFDKINRLAEASREKYGPSPEPQPEPELEEAEPPGPPPPSPPPPPAPSLRRWPHPDDGGFTTQSPWPETLSLRPWRPGNS